MTTNEERMTWRTVGTFYTSARAEHVAQTNRTNEREPDRFAYRVVAIDGSRFQVQQGTLR